MRITRPFVLLALAALMAPDVEASRTSVWESNPPAAAGVLTTTNAAGLLAPLASAGSLESIVADVEPVEPLRFTLGDVVLVENPLGDAFRLGLADVVEPPALRGPPLLDEDPRQAFELRDPENRIRGFELLPPFRVGASPTLSLWPCQACGFSCLGVVSDSRYDPWGLCPGCGPTFSMATDPAGTAAAVRDSTSRTAMDAIRQAPGRVWSYVKNEVLHAGDLREAGSAIGPQYPLNENALGLGVVLLSTADIATSFLQPEKAAVETGAKAGAEVVEGTAKGLVRSVADAVKEWEVGKFKDLVRRAVKSDRLSPDHIPSYGALKKAAEEKLGRKLTAAEATRLRNESTAVVVHETVHKAGETFGGKNTPALIAAHAQDLAKAAESNMARHIESAAQRGDKSAAEAAAEALRIANEAAGIR